ncbi:MAG TPA: nucleotide sugar dehydrogenase [Gaiellaceae bacterium]|nr:nucleotide sugar dehydrogenase [Gaiellaceae bacterium]
MKIGMFGAGYVGLVTGACFADLGHEVVIRDILPERIARLQAGEVPIYEPGLEEVLVRNSERIRFTLDVAEAVDGAEFLYVAVGTPPTESGDADLAAVWSVVDELPMDVPGRPIVVMKSTVPVGTGKHVRARLDARGLSNVGYVSNPEFLAEGSAVADFKSPDRIVVGAFDSDDADRVVELHHGINGQIVRTDVPSAELVKLAANAFLSTRISFINEIANVCELVGADVVDVAKGVGLDHRLGPHFLHAGIGFGGSCVLGEETVLARADGKTRLISLEQLYEETVPGQELEVLSWHRSGDGPEFLHVDVLTRREYTGDVLEVRTKMGRRVLTTPDHPFVTRDGLKLAEDLTTKDWIPLAQGAPAGVRVRPRRLNVVGAFERVGLDPDKVIVRPHASELQAIGSRGIQEGLTALPNARGLVDRSHNSLRSGALRLSEAAALDVEIEDAHVRTGTNGTYVPASICADKEFWRVVGLYIAEGCASSNSLIWTFHRDETDLVDDVMGFWRSVGVEPRLSYPATTARIDVASRLLRPWWTRVLGLGANSYEQRLPDMIWSESARHKRALLAGAWLGDGSWSYVNGGPSVILEYGTVSRELADGMLRLLGELGIVASLRVGRTKKSTCDTYWLRISGADQVEQLLDFVPTHDHDAIRSSIARQSKRIAPLGYRRAENAAWVRVVDVVRREFEGFVYSMEVPPAHTFVTTFGLTLDNCFPKDVSALKQLAGNEGYPFMLLHAVWEVNELQKRRVVQKLQKHLGPLRGKKIALLGLAFKPNTDDMREAPSRVIAYRLLAEGAEVRAWDPVARPDDLTGIELSDTVLDAVRDADAAVIVTEWPELATLASAEVRDAMARPLIVDGRNLLDPEAAQAAGFAYEGIGRPRHASPAAI